jgi:hypothetical protein
MNKILSLEKGSTKKGKKKPPIQILILKSEQKSCRKKRKENKIK